MKSLLSKLPLFAAENAGGGGGYWDELESKLAIAGEATNEFVHLCQDYWYIPMSFALVIVFALVIAGGKQGRLQAKSMAWWVFVSIAGIMSIPTIINLFASLAGKDVTDISTL